MGIENDAENGCVGPVDVACVYLRTVPGRSDSNARLIAAAPDLLAALERFIDYENAMDGMDDITGMLIYAEFSRMAHIAIAKATK